MGWHWSRAINFGPVQTTISHKELGTSFGFLGFRFGVSPDGRKYWSFGIPGTGLYYIKYY
jgi:hypothetical protein